MVESLPELLSSPAGTDFHSVLFDATPIPVFVLDEDSYVIDFNHSAAQFLETVRSEVFHHRTGDLFQCRYAMDRLGGCGTAPACAHCGIRYAIASALAGNGMSRCLHPMELIRNDDVVHAAFMVTSASVRDGDRTLALLILEDVTELMTLREQLLANALPSTNAVTSGR